MLEANIYKALGDPIRLEIVKRLASETSCTIGELSKNLGVSRQGARKQLQVLITANLVYLQQQGRETKVYLDSATLKIAHDFISKLEIEWDQRLNVLKQFAENDLQ